MVDTNRGSKCTGMEVVSLAMVIVCYMYIDCRECSVRAWTCVAWATMYDLLFIMLAIFMHPSAFGGSGVREILPDWRWRCVCALCT